MICHLCPRDCGAVRTRDHGSGLCRMPETPVLARAAQQYMGNLGLAGFTQERTSAKEEYTPPFDLTGL